MGDDKIKLSYALIGIFIFIVLDSIFKSIFNGVYLKAIIQYSILPIFLYLVILLLDGMARSHNKTHKDKYKRFIKPNILKLYIAWIPMLFSNRIAKWVRS